MEAQTQTQAHPQRIILVEQGKKNKMHTLWVDFINGSQYVKPRFVKNLSTDSELALQKAHEYAKRIGVDSSLVFDNTRDLNDIVKVYKWTDSMVRFGKNYGKELKDCDQKFIKWIAKGSPLQDEKSGCWYDNYFGGEDFCKIAQEIAVSMNLGKIEDRICKKPRFVSQEQYDKTTEFLAQKSLEKEDHHFESGQRIELTLTCVKVTGYESAFGYVNIYKFIDSENRVFTYKGTSRLIQLIEYTEIHEGKTYHGREEHSIAKGDTTTMTGTIKHDEFRGVKSTYLQRIKMK
jgi:hypothetical protein